jgi:hypothetical protein
VPSKEPPESGATAWNSSLAHRDKRLIQGQIRLPCNQSEQPLRGLLQWRRASAARLGQRTSGVTPAPHPFDRSTGTDLKVVSSLTPRSATLHSSDDSFSQLCRIRVRHSRPPNRINADRLPYNQALGNPAILLGRNML